MPWFAHSVKGRPESEWESLPDHLVAVGRTAAAFAESFGWGAMAGLAGRLHDIGKCSAELQAYIRGKRPWGGDHSGAGAIVAASVGLPTGAWIETSKIAPGKAGGFKDLSRSKRLGDADAAPERGAAQRAAGPRQCLSEG